MYEASQQRLRKYQPESNHHFTIIASLQIAEIILFSGDEHKIITNAGYFPNISIMTILMVPEIKHIAIYTYILHFNTMSYKVIYRWLDCSDVVYKI
jgi:hypothetical protein